MLQKTAFEVRYTLDPVAEPLRVNDPVRPIDPKEKRRRRVEKLMELVNAIHKDALARLAK